MFSQKLFFYIFKLNLGGLGVTGGMAWTIRRDSLELWQGLVLQDMGEVDFHVFGNIGNSLYDQTPPNGSLGLQIGPRIFLKARVPSQELSNKFVFQQMTPTKKYFPGDKQK